MGMMVSPYRFTVAVGTGWTPADLATDPVHWFDAQSSGTLTIDGSTNVSQWNDRGTAAANAAQVTSGNRPAYVAASGINSLPALRVNNTSNKSLDLTASWTIAHLQWGVTLADITLEFSTGAHSSNLLGALTTPNLLGIVWDATADTVAFYENGTLKDTLTGQTTLATSGAIFIMMDAVSTGSGGVGNGRIIGNTTKLFNRTDGIRAFDGDIGEIIYLNYVPTQSEREKVEGYMEHRWANQATLPAPHPYKSTAP